MLKNTALDKASFIQTCSMINSEVILGSQQFYSEGLYHTVTICLYNILSLLFLARYSDKICLFVNGKIS